MRVLGRILVWLVALVVILAAVAFVLPQTATVERQVEIEAPPEAIFPYVNSMQATAEWSPWLALDPEVELTYSGPEIGVGSTLNWASDDRRVGTGTQEITSSVENERVETALDFGPMGTAEAYFVLEPEGETTTVTWGFDSDLGMNPMARWMGLMLDGMVGGDYEQGLANLKAVVEG